MIHENDFLLHTGKIFLIGDIQKRLYRIFAEKIRFLISKKKNPIQVFITTDGGDPEFASAIVDDINGTKSLGLEVYTIGIGQVYSAGAFILAAGSKRFATEGTSLMIHPFSYDLGDSEHQSNKAYVNYTENMYNEMISSLAIKCGRKTPKDIKKFFEEIRDGKWLNAEQAVEFGLIDSIWNYSLENLN